MRHGGQQGEDNSVEVFEGGQHKDAFDHEEGLEHHLHKGHGKQVEAYRPLLKALLVENEEGEAIDEANNQR